MGGPRVNGKISLEISNVSEGPLRERSAKCLEKLSDLAHSSFLVLIVGIQGTLKPGNESFDQETGIFQDHFIRLTATFSASIPIGGKATMAITLFGPCSLTMRYPLNRSPNSDARRVSRHGVNSVHARRLASR